MSAGPGLHVSPIVGDMSRAELAAAYPERVLVTVTCHVPSPEFPKGFEAILSLDRAEIRRHVRSGGAEPLLGAHAEIVIGSPAEPCR